MSEYNIGKDVNTLEMRLEQLERMLQQVFEVIDTNIKNKTLTEPKEEKPK